MQRGFIFTRLGSFKINESIFEFPFDIYKLYINNYMDKNLKLILQNWLKNKDITDNEYKLLIENSFSQVKAGIAPTNTSDIFNILGVQLIDIEKFKIGIIPNRIEDIKVDTVDECLLNILKSLYDDILREEFPNYNISLGAWESESEDDVQSLNNSLRSAYKYTLVEYVYGNTASEYMNFEDFFTIEFWKRVHLVKNIWTTRKGNVPITYIPVFENLRNYDVTKKAEVIKALKTILDSGHITIDDKNEVKNQLYDQVSDSIKHKDAIVLNIKNDILQPVISKQVNWEKAVEALEAAKVSFTSTTKAYASAVNRSYYCMLYCVRSMMAEKGILKQWQANTLSPGENHKSVESGLKTLVSQGVLDSSYLKIYRKVKSDRWTADYADILIDSKMAGDSIKKAEDFLNKTETIIKNI